jgi:hypothetical protein
VPPTRTGSGLVVRGLDQGAGGGRQEHAAGEERLVTRPGGTANLLTPGRSCAG